MVLWRQWIFRLTKRIATAGFRQKKPCEYAINTRKTEMIVAKIISADFQADGRPGLNDIEQLTLSKVSVF